LVEKIENKLFQDLLKAVSTNIEILGIALRLENLGFINKR
jgi:hypothetical protein